MKVSIIIPVYNVASYIEDCLRSVMRQTYTGKMECLIVDDCGTDDSIEKSERMIAAYEGAIHFRILHHEQNRGLSAARNIGTLQATGDYIFYLDGDDEITDHCIETLMEKIKEDPDAEMVQGNTLMYFNTKKPVLQVKKNPIPHAVTNEMVRSCYYRYGQMSVNVWNKLLRRDFLIDNNILFLEGIIHEDNLWTFYLLKYLKRAAFVFDITYHYRIRPDSIMTGTEYKIRNINFDVIYHDILTHLTSGYEQEEVNYYAKEIALLYVRHKHDFQEVFQLCRDKCILYGCRGSRLRLDVSHALGQFKYGWMIWYFIRKIREVWRAFKNKE